MKLKIGLLGGMALGWALSVEPVLAQDEVAEPEPETASESTEEKPDTDPMGWFGIGLKLGVGGIGKSSKIKVDNPVPGATPDKIEIEAPSRTGFQLAVPINLGGDGFGWIFEPYLNFDSDVTAGGMYLGPTFNIHIMDPLYVGFGFGLKGAYWLNADGVDVGADIGARVPITGTYYFMDDLAAVVEFGFGYGGSGFAGEPTDVPDPNNPGQTVETDPSFGFGGAFNWDFTVGVRWP